MPRILSAGRNFAMPRILSDADVTQYRDEGYFFPVRVLSDKQVSDCRRQFEEFESSQGQPIHGAQQSKCHLLFTWIDRLMRSPLVPGRLRQV